MSRIEVDLSGFSATRTELDRVTSQQRAADAEVAAARAALAAAVRAGAATRQTQMLTGRIAAAQASRAALVDQRDALQKQLDGLANDLVRQRDPAALVGSLDGHFPIALLPVRLETRYISARGEPARLRIRIYPDDLNTIDHEAAPTVDEHQAAVRYWTAHFAHDDDEAARVLRDLTTNAGRGRATWVLRVTTPTNP